MRENRPERVKHLLSNLEGYCAPAYARATPDHKNAILDQWDALGAILEGYLNCEIPWDCQIIETIGCIEGAKFKTKEISSFDVVMEKARELLVIVTIGNIEEN